MIAAKHGESEIARVLMQAGADVRVVTKEMGKPTPVVDGPQRPPHLHRDDDD